MPAHSRSQNGVASLASGGHPHLRRITEDVDGRNKSGHNEAGIARAPAQCPLNPLGIKGAGESGITAVGATIASAIDDAIGMPGAVWQLPVTPQRLRRLLSGR